MGIFCSCRMTVDTEEKNREIIFDDTTKEVVSDVDHVEIPNIGIVDVTVINGFGKNGKVFAIHGTSSFVRNEWIKVGEQLAKVHDLAVFIPNLHSNPSTAPNEVNAKPAIKYLIEKHYRLNDVLLCGKSWGSKVVAEMACNVDWVRALILTNPINEDSLQCIHKKDLPLLYATNKNDYAISTKALYENEWKSDANLVIYVGPADSPALIKPTKFGGHMMSQSFIKPILDFAEKFYLKQ